MAMIEVDIALQLRWCILCRWFDKCYVACIYAVDTWKQQIFKKESQLQLGTTAIAFFRATVEHLYGSLLWSILLWLQDKHKKRVNTNQRQQYIQFPTC